MRAWRSLALWTLGSILLAGLASWALPLTALPPSGRVNGLLWRKQPSVYSPATLHKYIDGAADLYLAYGFREATVVEFYRGKQDVIMLDLYDMGRPIHAFGLYQSEKPAEVKEIALGAQGYLSDGLAAFWKGPYYVKLSVVEGKGEVLGSLARAADMYLPVPAELPVELRRLPAPGRVRGSERYVKKDALGHRFLVETVSADYRLDRETATLYVSDLGSPAAAQQAWKKLRDYEARNGKRLASVAGLHEEAFSAADPALGQMVASREGRFVIIAAAERAGVDGLVSLARRVVLIKPSQPRSHAQPR